MPELRLLEGGGMGRVAYGRIAPNEDLVRSVERLCALQCFGHAFVRGALGSLIDACLLRANGSHLLNDFLPLSRRDPTRFEGAALAWQRGLQDACITLDDLGFVETHDCFTVAELLEYEAMGLAPHGQGARVILEGVTRRDGRLPVNLSGGLKSRGHPIGATGVSQHVMAALQLSGTAGDMQVGHPRLGAVFNMGGAAVANYLSVLESA